MKTNISDFLNLILEKQKLNPGLAEDSVNYLKVVALKYCPEDRLDELKLIIDNGKLDDLYVFTSEFVPDLPERVQDYMKSY